MHFLGFGVGFNVVMDHREFRAAVTFWFNVHVHSYWWIFLFTLSIFIQNFNASDFPIFDIGYINIVIDIRNINIYC